MDWDIAVQIAACPQQMALDPTVCGVFNSFKQTFQAAYGYVTEGEIVYYDIGNHSFIVLVKSHSENWGQYQVNKFGRHSWHLVNSENATTQTETQLRSIHYSGALNFFATLDEAINDTDTTNGAADAIDGKFGIFHRK